MFDEEKYDLLDEKVSHEIRKQEENLRQVKVLLDSLKEIEEYENRTGDYQTNRADKRWAHEKIIELGKASVSSDEFYEWARKKGIPFK